MKKGLTRNKIGFWKNPYGYLSNPIGFVDGKCIRMRLIRNRYASKEKNTPTYLGYIDEGLSDEEILEAMCKKDENDNKYVFTYQELQDLINRIACDIGGDGEYGMWLVTDYLEDRR